MKPVPGEALILSLDKLRERLSSSGVERTSGLHQAMGEDCSFYRKSLDIFLSRDYDEIEVLLKNSLAEMKGLSND